MPTPSFKLPTSKFKLRMAPSPNLRNYLMITAGYWALTITDGAIRMLMVLVLTAVLLPHGVGQMKSRP